ncbi:ABATE domain-containing protein, partial [Streptomyces tricolor]|uniref:ABATE domain-containing protein n=1 Tax=Streptomyces tricolor TaxID=68277 RepID=UPI000D1CBA25
MEELVREEVALPSAPGEDEHPALALANSAVALPGGHTADLLGTPAQAEQWLTRRDLAPEGTGLAEVCTTQLRSLREQVRSLLASRVAGQPALPAAIAAINDAMTRVPTAPLLLWDQKTGPYRATPHPATAIVEHALAVIAADAADLLLPFI